MVRVKCPKCGHVNDEGAEKCVRCGTPLLKVRLDIKRPAPQPRPASAPQMRFHKDQEIAGRYTVIGLIGRGGMGSIYKVHDNTLNETVALKTLLPHFMRDKVIVERFFNEARIARQLSHPNIVRVHDIGTAGDVIYISMEYVAGQSLRGKLEAMPAGKRLPVKTALRVIDELCAALEYAHHYTVHRDIKPENIMLTEDGAVKLMDFGISKLMASGTVTATSMIMGTPYYMSPEQLRDSSRVDARADIYSVGVVLYEIVTGSLPTGVPKPASQIMHEVPPALDAIVAKCVDPEPDERYQSAGDLRAALRPIREIVDVHGSAALPARRRERPASTSGRRLSGVVLVLLTLLLAGLGLWGLENQRKRAAEAVPEPSAPAMSAAEREFADIADMIAWIGPRVRDEAKGNEFMEKVLKRADTLWQTAQVASQQNRPKALEQARQALQCFVAPVLCPQDMVFVPPGDVPLRDANGGGSVKLGGFFIDRVEVSNRRFGEFAEEHWRLPPNWDPSQPDAPVTMVTLYDAQAYAASQGKQLPTEAQWARAAYGAKAAPFPWGKEYEPDSSNVREDEDARRAAPVGSYEKDLSLFGCFDMVGNVSEWTRSTFGPLPYAPGDGREEPEAPNFGTRIAVRGGNYNGTPEEASFLNRYWRHYGTKASDLGFRCVRELPRTAEGIEALLARRAPAISG